MTCSGAGSGMAPGRGPHPAPGRGGHEGSDHLGCQRRLHRLPGPPARCRSGVKGDLQKEPPGGIFAEPADHGHGRSRGRLTSKIHLAVEQGQKLLSVVITAGQRGDCPQFEPVLEPSGFRGWGSAGRASGRTGSGPTRRTTCASTARTCADAETRSKAARRRKPSVLHAAGNVAALAEQSAVQIVGPLLGPVHQLVDQFRGRAVCPSSASSRQATAASRVCRDSRSKRSWAVPAGGAHPPGRLHCPTQVPREGHDTPPGCTTKHGTIGISNA